MMDIDWEFAGKLVWCLFLVGWALIRWVPNKRARKVKIAKTSRTPVERFSMAASTTGLGIIPAIWVFTGFLVSGALYLAGMRLLAPRRANGAATALD